MGVSIGFNSTNTFAELAFKISYLWLMSVDIFFIFCMTLCRSFVNNVWYIKILSPEDIQKMGDQAVEMHGLGSGQRLNGTGESHHIVSGQPPSIGSLDY